MTPENNLIKTVIVIGAGASKDFASRQNANKPDGDNKIISMPTGEELVRMMAEFQEGNEFFNKENGKSDIINRRFPKKEFLEAKKFWETNFVFADWYDIRYNPPKILNPQHIETLLDKYLQNFTRRAAQNISSTT